MRGVRRSYRRAAGLAPVIPAKAGIRTISAKPAVRNQVQIASDKSLPPLWACRGRRLVRIRIFRIIGFSGFVRLVFDPQAFIRVRFGGIFGYGENRKPGEVKS